MQLNITVAISWSDYLWILLTVAVHLPQWVQMDLDSLPTGYRDATALMQVENSMKIQARD
jgi:hypothetical protein